MNALVTEMVGRLRESAGDTLVSVVVYGPAAHGDYQEDEANLNLLIVLSDLSLPSIEAVGRPVRWWLKKGQAMPRFFSPGFIAEAADVFPMEFLDIRAHHHLAYGIDALQDLVVRKDQLRDQCERELREKMMRLQEAYIESEAKPRVLLSLMQESCPAFAAVFRGYLALVNRSIPAHDVDVIRAFCEDTDLDPTPFNEIDKLKSGVKMNGDTQTLFASYYLELKKAIVALNSLHEENGEKR